MKKDLCGGDRKYTRITVDLDILDEHELACSLKILKDHGFSKNVEIRLSPSGKGFHIIAWSDKGVTLKEMLKIREEAGDDPARIWFDSMAHRQVNVLFDDKMKRVVSTKEFLENLFPQ